MITEFLSLFSYLFYPSGPQQPPGGFRAAPGLSGGQEDQGIECRHQVDIFNCLPVTQSFLKTYHTGPVRKKKQLFKCLVSCRASTLSSAVSSLSSTGMSFSRMDEKEKQQALEEEQARLQALKVTDFLLLYQITSDSGGQTECWSSRNAGSRRSSSYCCHPFLPSYWRCSQHLQKSYM